MRTHQEIDARSLAMHRLVAEKIRRNPALLARAESTLSNWRKTVSASSQPYLQEWERLFQQGLDACLAVATEDSQRAAALRQCSPFAGILTNEERLSFLRDWSRDREAQRT